MPGARDNLAKIRGNSGGREDDNWTEHARLRRLRISEEYRVTQEISKNPKEDYAEDPAAGLIELAIPYDGHEFFPREARADVGRRLAGSPRPGDTAVIGHLVLEDFEGKTTGLPEPRESVPIRVGVAGPPAEDADRGSDGLGHLSADRWTCVVEHEYTPDTPEAFPARLKIDLFDPDSLDLPDLDLETEKGRDQISGLTGKITEKIRRQMSVRNPIILRIVACLTVPRRPGGTPEPKLTKMTIRWPVITSLRAVSLEVGDKPHQPDEPGAEIRYERRPVRYNPVTRCLEWETVRMFKKSGAHHDVVYFETPPMLLTIQQPGDLYRQDSLKARAEIKVPGYLMSGLTARLKEYDDAGPTPHPRPSLSTRVAVTAKLKLDDAFKTRLFSPYQHLFFDEIIPDEMWLVPSLMPDSNHRTLELDLQWITIGSDHRALGLDRFELIELYVPAAWGNVVSYSEGAMVLDAAPLPGSGENVRTIKWKRPKKGPGQSLTLAIRFENEIKLYRENDDGTYEYHKLTGKIQASFTGAFSGIGDVAIYRALGDPWQRSQGARVDIKTEVSVDFDLSLRFIRYQDVWVIPDSAADVRRAEAPEYSVVPDYETVIGLTNELSGSRYYVKRVIENPPRGGRRANLVNRYWDIAGYYYDRVFPIDFHVTVTGEEEYQGGIRAHAGSTAAQVTLAFHGA